MPAIIRCRPLQSILYQTRPKTVNNSLCGAETGVFYANPIIVFRAAAKTILFLPTSRLQIYLAAAIKRYLCNFSRLYQSTITIQLNKLKGGNQPTISFSYFCTMFSTQLLLLSSACLIGFLSNIIQTIILSPLGLL